MICTGLHGADICDSLSGEPAIISRLYGWRERMLARQLAYITYVRGSMSTLQILLFPCFYGLRLPTLYREEPKKVIILTISVYAMVFLLLVILPPILSIVPPDSPLYNMWRL